MQLFSYFTIIFIVISIINVTIIVFLLIFTRRNRKKINALISSWQMQSSYMDHSLEFCDQVLELSANVQDTIMSTSLSPSSESEKEQGYVDQCGQLLNSIHGGSTALKALLFHKKNQCENLNIDFIDEANALPDEARFSPTDAISIVGNLLDNAMEAAQNSGDDDPFVKVESIIRKNVWILTITNSKDPALAPKKNNMATTKADRKNHGMGTKIVSSLVAKHNGTLKTDDLGNVFESKAFLFLER
ncbi:MAG: ATP-binding protein [Bacillota bacterium]|nr:ATP-binding protein [Bacillota bacterium]